MSTFTNCIQKSNLTLGSLQSSHCQSQLLLQPPTPKQ
uniref:Uncharacterized protein n=1 Tax=Nelumbo nucifera TaxID=4432 RepID=A0A822Z8C1_NELNU|nr:TPA_asm: hypothetical protein HUJ06_015173 [Nelumbo nucifera]